MNTGLLADLVPYMIVAFFAYQIGKSNGLKNGKQEAKNQVDKDLQYRYLQLEEKLEDTKATVEGYKKKIREQEEYIKKLKR